MYSHFEPVLITSEDPRLEPFFTGYAFSGPHLIVSSAGYDAWALGSSTGLQHWRDGCYVLGRRTDDGFEVSADFKGYAKVFVYSAGARWAVGNSFASVVETARGKGWTVTPNEHVLETWSRRQAFWQQLATFETAAREVRVLPRQAVLSIDAAGALSTRSVSQPVPELSPGRYQRALARFLNIWIGRIGTTLRQDETSLTMELSGGLDSRVTLSLLLGLRQYFGVDLGRAFDLQSSAKYPDDFEVAQHLAKTFRLRLNAPRRRAMLGQTYVDPFERWWSFSLGSYAPHYWPARSHTVGHFKVGGHGGEGHRAYWPYESPHAVLEQTKAAFRSPHVYEEALQAFDDTREVLRTSYPSLPPTVAHYQEFRDRLHSGLHAQQSVRLQPLSSTHLYDVAAHAGPEALDRGQMLYDTMLQLSPGLATMPYDKESKRPSQEVLRQAAPPVELSPMRGRVHGLARSAAAPVGAAPLWERLRDTVADASRRLPPGLVDDEVVARAERSLATASTVGRLAHARDGSAVHHVVLADLVSR